MSGVAWDSDPVVAAWSGLPPLTGDRSADAVVVGLGASGLTAVAELADRGLSVVGVDAGRVAAGAAGRNGGFLLAGPQEPLHRAIELWGEDAAVALYRATLDELDALAPLRVGSIRLAGLPGTSESEAEDDDRARELEDCKLQADAMRAYGFAVEDHEGPLGSGLYFPRDAATNPARRAITMAAELRGRANLYERTRVRSVRPREVVTERGVISAPAIVVAVDGRLDSLVPALAPRVQTARLQMLATAPIKPGRLPCPVYGRWGYDYAQQSDDGRLFVGGGRDRFIEQEWTHLAEPSEPVQSYVSHVAGRMAGEPVAVTHRWAASVGFTADGRPLCTLVDDGVVAVGGYNGTGNLVGPVAARAAVAYVLDGVVPPAYLAS